ncbi:hypothetical protein HRI_000963000 [Hibiscus trionum]|uniref:Uncharacterized protein n=1 Tax=Hibiscus trionum TaxID=183268 RepID=A0A9W7H8J0_HIBTR|nr:hypothetical protein HRI_000963000 [Hibiscus trionum]
MLKDDVHIVLELPPHSKTLDIEAVGSLITDADIRKEAKLKDYVGTVPPLLTKTKVVNFLRFSNRLGLDPLPPELQVWNIPCLFNYCRIKPSSIWTCSIRIYHFWKSTLTDNLCSISKD